MRFFRARSPGNAAGESGDRASGPPVTSPDPQVTDPGSRVTDPGPPVTEPGLPVTDPAVPGQLIAAFTEPPEQPRPAAVDTLTLRDVTAFFAGQRPGDPRVKAGALLSAPHPDGRQVVQVFLDAADRVFADASGAPYGRRVIARRLDDDLLDYLGGGNLLIFR